MDVYINRHPSIFLDFFYAIRSITLVRIVLHRIFFQKRAIIRAYLIIYALRSVRWVRDAKQRV